MYWTKEKIFFTRRIAADCIVNSKSELAHDSIVDSIPMDEIMQISADGEEINSAKREVNRVTLRALFAGVT